MERVSNRLEAYEDANSREEFIDKIAKQIGQRLLFSAATITKTGDTRYHACVDVLVTRAQFEHIHGKVSDAEWRLQKKTSA